MGLGRKSTAPAMNAGRLASVAGTKQDVPSTSSTSSFSGAAPAPDPSRIRRRQIEETPEARKKRLAAKTVNFTATFFARIILMGALAYLCWQQYQFSGSVPRGYGFGLFAMVADFGRVTVKAMTPGTK